MVPLAGLVKLSDTTKLIKAEIKAMEKKAVVGKVLMSNASVD